MNNIDKKKVVSVITGRKLKFFRKRLGYSSQIVAMRVGCSQQQISRYENGETNISLATLFSVFYALNMNKNQIKYFFEFITAIVIDSIGRENEE